ncbi:TPA: M16 family metallopeptidase [Streptococcus suis]
MKLIEKNYPYMKESLYYAKLDNGLTVTLLPKPDFNEAYGVLTTEFGALHTQFKVDGKEIVHYPAGIAHFLEHKLFETEEDGDVMNQFAKLGASANAYTGFRQTSYLFSTTQEVLSCLNLLQSFVTKPYFTKENVEREQGIIEQEIEMYQDDADYRLYMGILASLYPGTPLAYDIAGTVESISQITADALYENYLAFYRPSNMHMFIVGNFILEEVWEEIIQTQENTEQDSRSFEKLSLTHLPILEHQTEQFEVATSKLAIGLRGNDHIAIHEISAYRICLQLLFAMLFGWTSKRYQALYEDGIIDSSFQFQIEVNPDYHFVVITTDTESPIRLSSLIIKAIQQFEKDMDITDDQLHLLKNEMYGDFIRSLNSLEFTASHFIEYLFNDETIFDLPEIIQSITLEDVMEVGRQFIYNCDMTDYTIFPK